MYISMNLTKKNLGEGSVFFLFEQGITDKANLLSTKFLNINRIPLMSASVSFSDQLTSIVRDLRQEKDDFYHSFSSEIEHFDENDARRIASHFESRIEPLEYAAVVEYNSYLMGIRHQHLIRLNELREVRSELRRRFRERGVIDTILVQQETDLNTLVDELELELMSEIHFEIWRLGLWEREHRQPVLTRTSTFWNCTELIALLRGILAHVRRYRHNRRRWVEIRH